MVELTATVGSGTGMRVRALVGAFLLGVVPWATPSFAGPPIEDALRLCRSDPVVGDDLRMSVKYQLMKVQGSEPDDEDVEAMMKLAQNMALEKCVTALSEDASIFRAFNGLSGFATEVGWTAWRNQCKSVAGPKGPCIEAEGRAGEELRSLNEGNSTSQRISRICQVSISDQSAGDAPGTANRAWLKCLKAGLKARPTAHALEECRFVSVSADASIADAMARCFRENAK